MSTVYVNVRIGRESYALPVESVLEVAELGHLTTVPGAGTGVLGVQNFHGQVLPVFDLAHLLGSPHVDQPSRLVVADHAGRLAGFAVEEVANVGSFEGALETTESEYLTSAVLEDGQLVGVVDLERVFAQLERGAA